MLRIGVVVALVCSVGGVVGAQEALAQPRDDVLGRDVGSWPIQFFFTRNEHHQQICLLGLR